MGMKFLFFSAHQDLTLELCMNNAGQQVDVTSYLELSASALPIHFRGQTLTYLPGCHYNPPKSKEYH